MNQMIRIKPIFGTVELKQFTLLENGKVVTYGYSITYDRSGKEQSRTEPSVLSRMGWNDGTAMTKNDYEIIKYGGRR